MGQRYSHLSLEERCRLRGLMEMGVGKSEIARRRGRHRSTIDREFARNRCVDGYRPDSAGRRAWARKLRGSKIARSTRLRDHVEDRLAMGWSPEQIPGRMELDVFAALVADAALVVTADTGAAHLASAYRIPSVVIFGPAPPEEWGPPESGPHLVLTHAELRVGDTFGAEPDPALLAVSVDEVLAAIATLPLR